VRLIKVSQDKKLHWFHLCKLCKLAIISLSLVLVCPARAQDEPEPAPLEVTDETDTQVVETANETGIEQVAGVRVANMLPGVSRIDLSVNGRLRIRDVAYGDVSAYSLTSVQSVELAIMPHVPISREGNVLEGVRVPQAIPFDVELEPETYYTLIFSRNEGAQTGQQAVINPLVSVFQNIFETPSPGQAQLRIYNTSAQPTTLALEGITTTLETSLPLRTLALQSLITEIIDIDAGVYNFVFGDDEAELELALQAGTFYSFYIFRDGSDLVVNIDVDGLIGVLIDEEQP
jgi:hypothetical protein